MTDFQETLEKRLIELLSARGLYLAERTMHEASSTDEVFISGRIAGASFEVWIYDDEAQFIGGETNCRFERYDYDTPTELAAAFLASLEEFLPVAENIAPIKLPILVNESSGIDAPGDLEFFERVADAESHLEAIDVENDEYIGFDAEGRQLRFDIVSGHVHISAAEAAPKHRETLRKLLISSFQREGETDDARFGNASLEKLIERGARTFPSSITMLRQKKAAKREPTLLARLLSFFQK